MYIYASANFKTQKNTKYAIYILWMHNSFNTSCFKPNESIYFVAQAVGQRISYQAEHRRRVTL